MTYYKFYKVELVNSSFSKGRLDNTSTLSFFIFLTNTSSTIKKLKKMNSDIIGYISTLLIVSAYCLMNLNMAYLFVVGVCIGKQNVDVVVSGYSDAMLDCGCGRIDLWLADVSELKTNNAFL